MKDEIKVYKSFERLSSGEKRVHRTIFDIDCDVLTLRITRLDSLFETPNQVMPLEKIDAIIEKREFALGIARRTYRDLTGKKYERTDEEREYIEALREDCDSLYAYYLEKSPEAIGKIEKIINDSDPI